MKSKFLLFYLIIAISIVGSIWGVTFPNFAVDTVIQYSKDHAKDWVMSLDATYDNVSATNNTLVIPPVAGVPQNVAQPLPVSNINSNQFMTWHNGKKAILEAFHTFYAGTHQVPPVNTPTGLNNMYAMISVIYKDQTGTLRVSNYEIPNPDTRNSFCGQWPQTIQLSSNQTRLNAGQLLDARGVSINVGLSRNFRSFPPPTRFQHNNMQSKYCGHSEGSFVDSLFAGVNVAQKPLTRILQAIMASGIVKENIKEVIFHIASHKDICFNCRTNLRRDLQSITKEAFDHVHNANTSYYPAVSIYASGIVEWSHELGILTRHLPDFDNALRMIGTPITPARINQAIPLSCGSHFKHAAN